MAANTMGEKQMKRFFLLLLSAFLTACSYEALRPEPATAVLEKSVSREKMTTAGYMTDQENELKQITEKAPFKIVRENNILALILSGKNAFSAQNQMLSSDIEKTLKAIAVILARYDKTHISIIGYANSGNPSADREVSEKRAQTVGDVLKASAAISNVRFWIEGSNPDTSLLSEDERQRNNHVDIILTPTFIR